MTRIVTTHYRYKRPPPKRKAVALGVPAVVQRVKPGDHEPAPQPAIVTAKTPGRRKATAPVDDGQSDPELRAWLERAKWGHGPAR